ncbi:UNVERIFIED_CONTAM: hypothetical protein FKN15_036752 [Acipenser sinensis]
MKKWSMTQNLTFREQLEAGIRYFDLRVSSKPGERGHEIYFIHGLFGHKVRDGLMEINSFLSAHSKEVIFLDFNHHYAMGEAHHLYLLSMLQEVFGRKLCRRDCEEEITLEYLWQKKYQVIVFYHHSSAESCPLMWPGTKIPAPWANTTDACKLIQFLETTLGERAHCGTFHVSQAILTPRVKTIVRGLIKGLRNYLVERVLMDRYSSKNVRTPDEKEILLKHSIAIDWCSVVKSPLDFIDTGKGLKVQTPKPHLVSLGSGRLSTAITLLPLEEGKTTIGREDAPTPQDITIEGPGIEAQHCFIENRGGVITLDPCGNLCMLDGVPVTQPTQLTQASEEHNEDMEQELELRPQTEDIELETFSSPSLFLGTHSPVKAWHRSTTELFQLGKRLKVSTFQQLLGLMAAASQILILGLLRMHPLQKWFNRKVFQPADHPDQTSSCYFLFDECPIYRIHDAEKLVLAYLPPDETSIVPNLVLLSKKLLAFKGAFLLAITSAKRMTEMQAFSIPKTCLIFTGQSLQKYVREQILLAVAVIVKRGSLDKSIDCKGIFHEVSQLISSGNPTVQTLACSILTALLSEFSSSSKTSNIGLSMEFHGSCKRLFQEEDLRQIFMLTVEVLQEFSRRENMNAQMSSVFQRYLALANQSLCSVCGEAYILAVVDLDFGLLGRHYIAMFESSQNVMLKPTESWRDTFLDSRVMELFFTVHRKIREDSDMAQDSLQCLAQLASVHGPVFPDESAQVNYLARLVEGLLGMINGLLSSVLRTSEVESRATRANLTDLLSPQMGKDIVWFLKRWSKTYLLVDEKLYDQISIPFSAAFGADTEGAQWIVGYILEKVINNLSVWSSESDLANDTVELLVTLVERRERANVVIQCENWWNLAKQFANRTPPLHSLSSSVQRTLMKALVLGGFAHMDSETKQQYWTEVRMLS